MSLNNLINGKGNEFSHMDGGCKEIGALGVHWSYELSNRLFSAQMHPILRGPLAYN